MNCVLQEEWNTVPRIASKTAPPKPADSFRNLWSWFYMYTRSERVTLSVVTQWLLEFNTDVVLAIFALRDTNDSSGYFVIWLYQLSWKCKLATVTSWKADVSNVSPSSERGANARNASFSTRYGEKLTFRSLALRQSEVLTLETSAFQRVTVANLHFQLGWYNQITLLPPPTTHHSFFRNFHP